LAFGFFYVLHRFCSANKAKPVSDLGGDSAKFDATNLSEAVSKDECRFLKRADAEIVQSDDDQALAAIEQEMLAIKQLFADGHILKDVYVTETRRLYVKAKSPKQLKLFWAS
jgi:hypothetical protein